MGVETRDPTQVRLEKIGEIPENPDKILPFDIVYGIYSLLSGTNLCSMIDVHGDSPYAIPRSAFGAYYDFSPDWTWPFRRKDFQRPRP